MDTKAQYNEQRRTCESRIFLRQGLRMQHNEDMTIYNFFFLSTFNTVYLEQLWYQVAKFMTVIKS